MIVFLVFASSCRKDHDDDDTFTDSRVGNIYVGDINGMKVRKFKLKSIDKK